MPRFVAACVVLLTLVSSAAVIARPPAIQSPVCAEACPNAVQFPVQFGLCQGRVTSCNAKLGLYAAYMGQMGLGVEMKSLPQLYVDILAPHYPGMRVSDWRFGWSNRQTNPGITDCKVTYYPGQPLVNDLRDGKLHIDTEYRTLFHEMVHVEQCLAAGGRDAYAKMWFDQIPMDRLQTGDMTAIHRAMPMEAAAIAKANDVWTKTRGNRDHLMHFVRPIVAVAKRDGAVITTTSTVVGNPVRLTGSASGGSAPIVIKWFIRAPGRSGVFERSTVEGATLDFTPDRAGDYEVTLWAEQTGSALTAAAVAITLRSIVAPVVTAPRPALPSTIPGTVQSALNKTLTVTVTNLAASPLPATVCVGDATNADRFGLHVADRNGRATFEVKTGLPVRVTAQWPGHLGVARSITMPSVDHRLTIALRPGVGGAACR